MAYYGSNYPSSGYGGDAAYPSNSGPPMPPGVGFNTAYNVNQYGGYGAYSMSRQTQGFTQEYSSSYTSSSSTTYSNGVPPGFTVLPVVQQCQQQYGSSEAPPPLVLPPMSMQYANMQNMMSNVSLQQTNMNLAKSMGIISDEEFDEEEKAREEKEKISSRRRALAFDAEEEEVDKEEEKRKQEERIRKAEERARILQEKLNGNEDLKQGLKTKFVEELMRRQALNGNFEDTSGTIVPFDKYDAEDPVAKWYQQHKGSSIENESWDPMYDSEYLYDAIKGWGTNEQAIIDVCVTRCNAQRQKIVKEYKTCYGQDLIEDLKGDLSFNFKHLVLGLFESPARYDAWAIKDAIYGPGTDEASLVEILLTRTNGQIQEMVSEYNHITYDKGGKPESSVEKDIEGDTSGDFKRLLISACQGNRRLIEQDKLEEAVEEVLHNDTWTGMFRVNYHKLCNIEKCKRMAKELFDAGEDKWGTDEETFNRIFSTMDYYTLRLVWDEYVKISQRDILNSVERETSGNFKKGLMAVAQNIKCRPMFFAERLYNAMKGLGTDDSTLIRIVVSRSEIDMVQIKACFLEKYRQTLWNFIKDDTTGDYRKLLCAIVGKN